MRHVPHLSATIEEQSYSQLRNTAGQMHCWLIVTPRAVNNTSRKHITLPYTMKEQHIHICDIFYATEITVTKFTKGTKGISSF